jgi:hypothetical protein
LEILSMSAFVSRLAEAVNRVAQLEEGLSALAAETPESEADLAAALKVLGLSPDAVPSSEASSSLGGYGHDRWETAVDRSASRLREIASRLVGKLQRVRGALVLGLADLLPGRRHVLLMHPTHPVTKLVFVFAEDVDPFHPVHLSVEPSDRYVLDGRPGYFLGRAVSVDGAFVPQGFYRLEEVQTWTLNARNAQRAHEEKARLDAEKRAADEAARRGPSDPAERLQRRVEALEARFGREHLGGLAGVR